MSHTTGMAYTHTCIKFCLNIIYYDLKNTLSSSDLVNNSLLKKCHSDQFDKFSLQLNIPLYFKAMDSKKSEVEKQSVNESVIL